MFISELHATDISLIDQLKEENEAEKKIMKTLDIELISCLMTDKLDDDEGKDLIS